MYITTGLTVELGRREAQVCSAAEIFGELDFLTSVEFTGTPEQFTRQLHHAVDRLGAGLGLSRTFTPTPTNNSSGGVRR